MVKMNKEILNASAEDVIDAIEGKDIIFGKIPEDEYLPDGIYISNSMREYSNERVKVEKVLYNGDCVYFRIPRSTCSWSLTLIDYIVDNSISNSEVNFKKGDLCKIKSNNVSIKDTGKRFYGVPIVEGIVVNKKLENREFVICDIVDGNILPMYTDGYYYEDVIIKPEMIELVEANYIENIREQKEQTRIGEKKKRILDDYDTIEEMKSKVNEKDFRKIYAGALKLIPNDMKGVPLVLHEWAYNKKHIYKMFGNKLSLQKELEYTKSQMDVNQDREVMIREFPGMLYVMKHLDNQELLENKLHHTIDGEFTNYSRIYKPGERVSKMFDEVFKNDKLNILYSNIIAQNKIRGVIEVSIDPIEYLLMSCNISGWTSCHTIHKIGEGISYGSYSSGLFSYMCDNVSMIAFRHDGKLYDFQINKQKVQERSKNWRQMVWISKDFQAFIASRQYPNYVPEIAKTVRELLEDQIDVADEEKVWVHTSSREKMEYIMSNRDENKYSNLHYNDILHDYDGDLCYKKDYKLTEDLMLVGSHPACPACGKEILVHSGCPRCSRCNR